MFTKINKESVHLFGYVGLFAASLYFLSLDLKHRFGLFSIDDGLPFILNHLGFVFAMIGLLTMLFGMWQASVTGNQPIARIVLAAVIVGWTIQIAGEGAVLLNADSVSRFIWIGESIVMIAAIVGGIEAAIDGSWRGWRRYVLLLLGLLALLTLRTRSLQAATLFLEAQIVVGWFFVALALATSHGAIGQD